MAAAGRNAFLEVKMNVYDAAETGVSFLLKTIGAYLGAPAFLFIFLLMLVLTAIFGKKKGRTTLLWPFVILALTIFNPYVFPLIFRADTSLEEDYYQCLWLVPVAIIMAFGITLLIWKFKASVWRFLVAAVFAAAVLVTGTPSLAAAMEVQFPENVYMTDGEIVSVCDYLDQKAEKDTPAVAFESEDDQNEARAYDASLLPSDILRDKDKAGDVSSFRTAAAADDAPDYFVVQKGGDAEKLLENAGLSPLASAGSRIIYRNTLNQQR